MPSNIVVVVASFQLTWCAFAGVQHANSLRQAMGEDRPAGWILTSLCTIAALTIVASVPIAFDGNERISLSALYTLYGTSMSLLSLLLFYTGVFFPPAPLDLGPGGHCIKKEVRRSA